MATESITPAILQYVALCNDQTEALIDFIERYGLPTPEDQRRVINHMRLVQRSLAKTANSEIEWMNNYTSLLAKLRA